MGGQGIIHFDPRKIFLVIVTAIVAFLVIPPIGMLLFSSVRSTETRLPFEATAFTITNYIRVFGSPVTYRLLINTAYYTIGSVIIGLAVTTFFAWFLERTNVPFRRIFFVLVLLPMGIPGIVSGMGWILLANPTNGLLNLVIRSLFDLSAPGPLDIYSIPGMITVTALRFIPVMYIMISGVFGRMDPAFEEAGRMSGAGSWETIRRISMPLLIPAILSALIYYTVLCMEIFEIAGMLGMPRGIFVFASAIYYAIHRTMGGSLPNYGLASTYGTVLLIVAALLIYLYFRHLRHTERYATVTGRGYRPALIDLGVWRFVPVVAMGGYFLFAVVLPILILLWTSLTPKYATVSLSALSVLNLKAYREMLRYGYLWTAAVNTLTIAVVAAFVTMFLVTLASWLSVRSGMRGLGALPERLAFLVLGIPGVVLSLSLIFVYAPLPIPLYGTIWIIIIAEVTRALSYGTRLMTSAFLQIHRELEDAASMSGASQRSTFFRIVLPLLWPSFGRGLLWVFSFSIRDATIPLMLYAAGNQTIAVTLWFLWVEEADFPLASAIAVPLVLITSVLAYLIARKTMLTEEAV